MQEPQMFGGEVPFVDNVEIRHFDKDGNVKPIFQENGLFLFLMKHGILTPHTWKIPVLLGHWSDRKNNHNLITSAGKAGAAAILGAVGAPGPYKSIGQGTGTTSANVADTTLETGKKADGTGDGGVHALAAASVTNTQVTTTVTNDTLQAVGTVAETATMAITESGLFNADTNGTMLARQVFSAINVVTGDSIQFTWKIKAA